MTRPLAWGGIVLLPVLVVGALWGLRRDLTQPNLILPTQMAKSPAYRSQTANPVLERAMTMQPAPSGTLARRDYPLRYAVTDAERRRAGEELINPFRDSSQALRQGRAVYETFCLVCHGASGAGDGPLIPQFPNPPHLGAQDAVGRSDGEMFHIISLGHGKMAGYAAQVPWEDRWRVIVYIRSLQARGR